MGKAGGGGGATAAKRKKKGRPSLLDLQKRALEQHQQQSRSQQKSQRRKSGRRNPNSVSAEEDEYYDDDDDERKEKKVKLVVRLPQSDQRQQPQPQQQRQQHLSSDLVRSSSVNSASCGSDSNADADNRKINSGSGGVVADHGVEKVSKAMDTLHGSPLEAGPTRHLPDKKLLVFIIDRLQKKDTHGVFSEPVDPNELPDYHEIIEQPMDFGTVKSKLDNGLYSSLEEVEADVLLICSNAMLYNSSDTIYFRQARTILELAKKDFENLRQMGGDGQLQPKVVKRGRPPGKQLKKPPPAKSPLDLVAPESTSGATLATAEDHTTESTPYNLRKGPLLNRHTADGSLASHRSRNGEHYSELLSDWNEEFPARIRRADMKYGKKHFNIDETRRDTYKQFHPSAFPHDQSLLSNFGGERKQLLAVGLHAEYGYARSLARFAANMGPAVWNVASKKLERALPSGVKFAPGVVGENEPTPPPPPFSPSGYQRHTPKSAHDALLNPPETPSISNRTIGTAAAHTRANPQNEPPSHHGRNSGFGMLQIDGHKAVAAGASATGYAQCTTGQVGVPGRQSLWQQVSSPLPPPAAAARRQFALPVPPDLNVGLQGPSGSAASGLRIGSPQQPDLALQL